MKMGMSASREMHLSACGYCKACDMLVEIGTSDCPHAINFSKGKDEQTKSSDTKQDSIEQVRPTRFSKVSVK